MHSRGIQPHTSPCFCLNLRIIFSLHPSGPGLPLLGFSLPECPSPFLPCHVLTRSLQLRTSPGWSRLCGPRRNGMDYDDKGVLCLPFFCQEKTFIINPKQSDGASESFPVQFSRLLLFSCWVMSDYFATLWNVAQQAPCLGIFQEKYWSGLPFPSPSEL